MTNTAFFDSHAHLNLIVKKDFDRLLNIDELNQALVLLDEMELQNLKVVNIGTSLTESINCLEIAKLKPKIAKAALGIHPNDITENWQHDLAKIEEIITPILSEIKLDTNIEQVVKNKGGRPKGSFKKKAKRKPKKNTLDKINKIDESESTTDSVK